MTFRSTDKPGFRVGIAGASTLLGQEIERVLESRPLPVLRVYKLDSESEEPEIPILDVSGQEPLEGNEQPEQLDAIFLAARPRPKNGESDLLGKAMEAAAKSGEGTCLIVDAVNTLSDLPGRRRMIPSCPQPLGGKPQAGLGAIFSSPHPASILLSRILLSVAQHFRLKDATAHLQLPASELGPKGIDELQKQTVSLLSFQKAPQKVFGAQLAFNHLSRLPGKNALEGSSIEKTVREELRDCLGGLPCFPAISFSHAPVFYSLACSLYVSLEGKASPEAVAKALGDDGMSVSKRSDAPPTQVDAAGSAEILLDHITADPDRPGGYWIWAVVDNIRLAAENAVDIAAHLLPSTPRKQ